MMALLTNPETSEQARPYLTDAYVQHNPNLESGADSIIAWTKTEASKRALDSLERTDDPPVFVAEDDMVVMMVSQWVTDPDNPSKRYKAYWFDMWRVEDGKLAEHWDAALKEAE